MITSISASNSHAADGAGQAAAAQLKSPTVAVAEQGSVPVSKADTVKLSLSAQVHALYHQGMSANQIAANLGMPVKSVSSYLPGSTPAAPAATPAAAASEAPEASAASSNSATAPASAQGAPAAAVSAKS
jgi:hypothetical protein